MKKSSIIISFINWIIYILGYTLVIFLTDFIFDSLYSENIFYDLLAALIIYILQKLFKPIIFRITIPITAITFGLFYPFIDLFLLKITDFILSSKFDIYGIFWGYFVALMISIMNYILESMILKPIIRRGSKNE